MRFALIFAIVRGSAVACHALDGGQIMGKDLAAASLPFAALDPDFRVGAAPLPGVQRVLGAADLVRIAQRNGLLLSPPIAEVCFERATEPLTPEKLLPALRAALGIDGAQIEILEFSRAGVPRGSLQFTRAGLSANGFWRGSLSFDENRSVVIWARVRVTTEQTWVEAAAPLSPGKPLVRSQLKLAQGSRNPLGAAPIGSIDLVADRAVRRAVKPGEPIFASMLMAPHEVERGDTVAVDVSSGRAHLSLDAVSQSSGRAGEFVLLKNPENGRFFQARVTGKDKASIDK